MTTPIAPAPVANGPTTAKVKPSGWWVALAIFLLVVGPGGCTTVLVTKSVSFINGYNRYASFRMPVEDRTVRLRQSTERVGIFLRSANESGGAAVEDIRVTSPSGRAVALLTPQDSINAPVPSGGYLSILRFFRVEETGEYRVSASAGAAAEGAELGVGKYNVDDLGAWLAGGFAVGGVVFLIGLVMLIIVLVRRSRSRREIRMAGISPGSPYWGAPGGSPPPPPGWGGPPQGPPAQYPPFPVPPQAPPQASTPGWTAPSPPSAPPSVPPVAPPAAPPPEPWAPAPWSSPTEPTSPASSPPPPPPPPPAEPPPASPPSGVPAAPVSAPIPTVRPWQDAPRRSPKPEAEDDDEPGAPNPPV